MAKLLTRTQGINLHLEIELVVTRASSPEELNSDEADTQYVTSGGMHRLAGAVAPKDLLPALNLLRMSVADMAEAACNMVMTLATEGLKGDALECRERYKPVLLGWIENLGHFEDRKEEVDAAKGYLADMLAIDIDGQPEVEDEE